LGLKHNLYSDNIKCILYSLIGKGGGLGLGCCLNHNKLWIHALKGSKSVLVFKGVPVLFDFPQKLREKLEARPENGQQKIEILSASILFSFLLLNSLSPKLQMVRGQHRMKSFLCGHSCFSS